MVTRDGNASDTSQRKQNHEEFANGDETVVSWTTEKDSEGDKVSDGMTGKDKSEEHTS